MGVRLTYFEVPKDDIKTAIIEDYHAFKRWYESIAEEYPEEPNYDILEFLLTIETNVNLFDQIPDKLINDFVDAYLDFCDYGPGKLSIIKDSSLLKIYNYTDAYPLVKQKCSAEIAQLWKAMIKGRSIVPSQAFKISNPYANSTFCFLSEQECKQLITELTSNFDESNTETHCAITATIQAIENKKGLGMLVFVG